MFIGSVLKTRIWMHGADLAVCDRKTNHPLSVIPTGAGSYGSFAPINIAVDTIVGTRGKGEVSTGSNHLGVRLVKDPH